MLKSLRDAAAAAGLGKGQEKLRFEVQCPHPEVNKRPKHARMRGLVQATAGQVHLGTRDPCRLHATASRVCLLRSID